MEEIVTDGELAQAVLDASNASMGQDLNELDRVKEREKKNLSFLFLKYYLIQQ